MRAQIMGTVLAKTSVSESKEEVSEAKSGSKTSDDNVFKFRTERSK